jgi:hypothetical protein
MSSLLKRTAAAGALFSFLLLYSCGEFDSVFPVNQIYQVSAMAGDSSLDEYSGIRLNDEIRPFFVQSISGDQDITGLVVFLQTPDGKPAGEKIRYSIGGAPDEEEEEDGELLIRTAREDEKLPYFRVSEELKAGPYRMVFQILGEKGKIFSKTEKPVFYLAAADYSISEITVYLPGYSQDAYLIAPGTVIMLEAKVRAGEGLDPYVLWYDGKKRISEGKISAGGDKFFFKVPEENGFRLLRAEAFPFPPAGKDGDSAGGETARGKLRELSLPVSVKGTGPEYFSASEEDRENFAGHYLFSGDLRDSLDPRPERDLVREDAEGGLNWFGYGGIYGLAVGRGDCYLIPEEIPGPLEQEQGERIFNFRCKMIGDGPVFSLSLPKGLADLELSREGENLVLTLKTEGNSGKFETALPSTEDFISFALSLDFRENTLAAVLSLEGMPETKASLNLAGPAGDVVIYRLGAPVPGEEETSEEEAPPAGLKPELPVLILDELAVTVRKE